VILDTNALSAFVDGEPAVGEILRAQTRAALPVIVLGEYRYGIAASRHKATYEQWLANHLAHFDALHITPATTIAYAAVRVALKNVGRPIPANDVWIAALAWEHRLPVLSKDTHFDSVPQLQRIGW